LEISAGKQAVLGDMYISLLRLYWACGHCCLCGFWRPASGHTGRDV